MVFEGKKGSYPQFAVSPIIINLNKYIYIIIKRRTQS